MGCWKIANNLPFLELLLLLLLLLLLDVDVYVVELNKEFRRCRLDAVKKSAWMLDVGLVNPKEVHCSIPWGVERSQFI